MKAVPTSTYKPNYREMVGEKKFCFFTFSSIVLSSLWFKNTCRPKAYRPGLVCTNLSVFKLWCTSCVLFSSIFILFFTFADLSWIVVFPDFCSVVDLFLALKDTIFYSRKLYKATKQISEKIQPSGTSWSILVSGLKWVALTLKLCVEHPNMMETGVCVTTDLHA